MVEVNISVQAKNSSLLQSLLQHIIKEITDEEYRLSEINNNRKVDMDWVYLDEGKYQWHKNERA